MAKVKKSSGGKLASSLTGVQSEVTQKLLQMAQSRSERIKDWTRPGRASAPDIAVQSAVPTGSKLVDLAVRRVPPYGLPIRRLVEVFSLEESEGKSLLIENTLANAQKLGMVTQLQDSENSYSPDRGAAFGIDNDLLIYDCPPSVETVFDELDYRLDDLDKVLKGRADFPGLVYAWDTLTATPTFAELNKKASEIGYGVSVARMMSYCLKRACRSIAKNNVLFLVVNQGRVNPSVLKGDPTCTAGGKALRFYASVRLLVKKLGPVCDARGRQVGMRMRVWVKKNKVSRPDGVAEFDVLEEGGIQDKASWFWFFHNIGRLKDGASGRYQLELPDGGGSLKFTKKSFAPAMEDAGKVEAVERYMEALAAQREVPMKFHSQIQKIKPGKGKTATQVSKEMEEEEEDKPPKKQKTEEVEDAEYDPNDFGPPEDEDDEEEEEQPKQKQKAPPIRSAFDDEEDD